ncbi:WXG100 family type VII secretion target [Amycolatopsis sp. cg5]|uniref:WXG100 family type VII secretion target n=1 Tax=Amycolatopsis sp. cg5 TaxID=3238802 RepID=UPI003524E547
MGYVSAEPPPPEGIESLSGLSFEQLAQLVNEVGPEAFYQRAAAFDQAGARLQDVLDQVRREERAMQEFWDGQVAESFGNVVYELTVRITSLLQTIQSPGYGTLLRQAGDQLAMHQQRMRDLQLAKAEQDSAPPAPEATAPEVVGQDQKQRALQIVSDLSQSYQQIGSGMAPPVDAPDAPGTQNTGPNVVGDGAPDTGNTETTKYASGGGGGGAGGGGLLGTGMLVGGMAKSALGGSRVQQQASTSGQMVTASGQPSGVQKVFQPTVDTVPPVLGQPTQRGVAAPSTVGAPVLLPGAVVGRKQQEKKQTTTTTTVKEQAIVEAVAPTQGVKPTTVSTVDIPVVDKPIAAVANGPSSPELSSAPKHAVATGSASTGGVRLPSVEVAPLSPQAPVRPLPAELAALPTGASSMTSGGAAPVAATTSHAAATGGMPMAPMMMGGLRGNDQDTERDVDAMLTEDPDVWDPATGAPAAIGRPARKPEPEAPLTDLLPADLTGSPSRRI